MLWKRFETALKAISSLLKKLKEKRKEKKVVCFGFNFESLREEKEKLKRWLKIK